MNNANTTVKRPFEMKAERNKETLNNFLSSSTEEYQTMVNALLAFWNGNVDVKIGTVKISIGQRTDNGFNAMLISFTYNPNVIIGNWNDTEPTICIATDERKTNNILCSLNLSLIDNLKADIQATENFDRYVLTFRYDNCIDYKIEVVHKDFTKTEILNHIAE